MEQASSRRFGVHQIPGRLAIVRLEPGSDIPSWSSKGTLSATIRTPDELTIVCDETMVPESAKAKRDWVALMVEGPLAFSMTGILWTLLEPLAAEQIAVFVLSTIGTDYILVKANQVQGGSRGYVMMVIGSFEESSESVEVIGSGSLNWGHQENSFTGTRHRDKWGVA
jgi:hypothetical protein